MAGHEARGCGEVKPGVFQRAQDGEADRHQRRLRILRQDQFFARPVEHQPGQALRQRIVHFLEDQPGDGRRPGQVPAHADGLGALPRKDEYAICHEICPGTVSDAGS